MNLTDMVHFIKITKKKFVEDMTTSNVIFVQGGFSKKSLDDADFESMIVSMCENVDIDNEVQCICKVQSNALVRCIPNGRNSYLYFDTEGSKYFYEYQNIRIVETIYKDDYRRNYVIYLCV